MESSKIQKLFDPLLLVFFAVSLRIIPHPANMAPVAAMALFGGAYFGKKYAFIVPLLVMFISDIFLGFHSVMIFVYGSFLITGMIGLWLKGHKKVELIAGASLLSSLLFYLITNFGVWMVGSMYPKTLSGLLDSYFMALPFFRNTIVGDLLYTGLFFGGYALIKNLIGTVYGNIHQSRG